ncbi:MAG: hypothetical protein ACL93V_06490 [Candidatus Electrothrix sp. YB6]
MKLFRDLYRLLPEKKKEPGYTYRLPGRPLEKDRKPLYGILLLAVLAVTGAGILYTLPFSARELGRMLQDTVGISAADDQNSPAEPEAGPQQHEPVLRGTIYDRDMEEMAISYQFFSFFVQPSEIADWDWVAEKLAMILGTEKENIMQRLQNRQGIVELADNLAEQQVAELEELRQPGIYCRPVEIRYYPGHAVAGHLLGFVSGDAGLSGIEALYDTVLEPGQFRQINVPAINFSGYETLGKTVTDVVLTLDMELQKRLDEVLDEYRQQKGAVSGSAVVMDIDTGRMLAMVSEPGFDPNYFWQTDEQQANNAVFAPKYVRHLVRPLLVQAAAVLAAGMDRELLPVTVSEPEYGLNKEQTDAYLWQFGLQQPVPDFLPIPSLTERYGGEPDSASALLSSMQLTVGLAALLNNGYRVTPWLVRALYDHTEQRFFPRDLASSLRERVLSPIDAIRLRQEILKASWYRRKEGLLFVNTDAVSVPHNGFNKHFIQDILLAAVPKQNPKLLLVFTVDYNSLYPHPPEADTGQDKKELAEIGHYLLPLLAEHNRAAAELTPPPTEKNTVNMRRYFFTRRLKPSDLKKEFMRADPIMPQLIGLSLRKGLQQINLYNVQVRIRGSGRIVAQKPAAGEPLTADTPCELILESTRQTSSPWQETGKKRP